MSYRKIQVVMCSDMISHQGWDMVVTCITVQIIEGCTLYESNPNKKGGEVMEIKGKCKSKGEGSRSHSHRFQKRDGKYYLVEFWLPREDR